MTIVWDHFPGFFLKTIIFVITFSETSAVTNEVNFEFEKSLSSCEKPCYNGVCLNRSCICSKGWYGPQCDHCFGRIKISDNSSSIVDGPQNYSSSAKCTWFIEPENNHDMHLSIKINSFQTECGWDYLYIYDGDSIYGNQLAALCGEQDEEEFTAVTGKAFIYFFSDLAMNLDGFNVSFVSNSCPYNCSSRGTCTNGTCICESGYEGRHCELEYCTETNERSDGKCNGGKCVNGICDCSETTYHGTWCQKSTTESAWDKVSVRNNWPNAKASHATLTFNDSIWSVGGEQFNENNNSISIDVFNTTDTTWKEVLVTKAAPSRRYDHTIVKYKNKIYMFGGVKKTMKNKRRTEQITNELWVLNISSMIWSLVNYENDSDITVPFAVAGHSAHVIGHNMYVFFGYNPIFGFMHQVQIFNFESAQWSVANTSTHVYGRFKHSSIEYKTAKGTSSVLVYGGIMWNSTITDSLMEFDIIKNKWTNLPQSGVQLYFHSAVYLNGLMIITGGRGSNIGGHNKNKCFSNLVISFDVACKQWSNMSSSPQELRRYGHATQVVKDKVYIIGGFNGKMIADVWTLTPAQCSIATKPEECRSISDGTKCVFTDSSCIPFNHEVSYKATFLSVVKTSSTKLIDECTNTLFRQATRVCEEQMDCISCASKSGCGWCSSEEQCLPHEQECVDGPLMLTSWEKCSQKKDSTVQRPCSMEKDCGSCRMNQHCTWYPVDRSVPCVSKEELIAVVYEYETKVGNHDRSKFTPSSHYQFGRTIFRNSSDCSMPCSQRSNCSECVDSEQCMWCPSTNRCISLEAYTLSFAYGQCHSWVTSSSGLFINRICQAESSICEEHKTCGECQRDPGCGWLADDSKTGLGLCTEGTSSGPLASDNLYGKWHFVDCPACQCNGHSTCVTSIGEFPPITFEKCQACNNNTIGAHCERCAPGYFGDSRNGGQCSRCQCNKQADMCDSQTGQCYCRTKGVIGDHCDKCEAKYIGNPRNGTPCYYELAVDFIFTFKLKNDDKDNHTNEIFLYSVPYKKDTDVTFQISCDSSRGTHTGNALVALNMTSSYIDGLPEHTQTMMVDTVCDSKGFRRVYVASDKGYPFGPDSNTTFFVRVYNFTTPVQIVVSFAQSPPINWVLFFVIFAACFIVLLVVAGLLWMIKVRIAAYRRHQRRIDEIEHMASRPFASTKMELSMLSQFSSAGAPTPLSVEPCSNYKAGVFTLAVRLPTGGKTVTPNGTSGLAVASSLCLLTPQQVGVLQAQENDENINGRKNNFRNLLRLPIRQRNIGSD